MNSALIDPRNGRVCATVPKGKEYDVAEPLYWTDCDASVATEAKFDGKEFVEETKEIPQEDSIEDVLIKAVLHLVEQGYLSPSILGKRLG